MQGVLTGSGSAEVDATSVYGFVLPRGLPGEAAGAVAQLDGVSGACRSAVQALDAGPGLAPGWEGVAAGEYRQRRALLAQRCAQFEELAGTAAGLVRRWSVAAAADREAMVRARAAVQDVVAEERMAAAAGQLYRPDLTAAHDRALGAWAAAQDDYRAGVTQLAQQLDAVRDVVSDRQLSAGDQARAFVQTVWDGGVAGPAEQVWSLTGQVLVDPAGWWGAVRSVPGQARDLVAEVFHDPLGVLGRLVDAPAWSQGHAGEGLGAATVLFLPGHDWLELDRAARPLRVLRRGSEAARAWPRLQTVDELLQGVDLERHEHPDLGHTLDRHVEVDDAYLKDRLAHGTPLEDGGRAGAPKATSRFTDRATAQTAITQVLRANEAALRDFAAHPSSRSLELSANLGRDIGVVYSPAGPGAFRREPGQLVRVLVKAGPGGRLFIESAYVLVGRG